jgi:hypothetical protein
MASLDATQLAAENAGLRAEIAELKERSTSREARLAFLEAFYTEHAAAEPPGDADADARAAAIEVRYGSSRAANGVRGGSRAAA